MESNDNVEQPKVLTLIREVLKQKLYSVKIIPMILNQQNNYIYIYMPPTLSPSAEIKVYKGKYTESKHL